MLIIKQETSLESSVEDAGALVGSCGPLAAVAVGRLSAFQNWLRCDGSVVKEAPSPPPRSRFASLIIDLLRYYLEMPV